VRELTGTRRLVRRFERGSRALILLYHRIDTPIADPWTLAVSPKRFDEHLAVLRERFRPLALAALVAALRRGSVPARAVALTFDDGYADNLLHGVPLLEQYTVPATVYVTAGLLGAAHEFWWKQVEQLLLEPGELPQHLRIVHPVLRWSWDLQSVATYHPEHAEKHSDWTISDRFGTAPTARHAAFLSLLDALERVDPVARDEILAGLFSRAGVDRASRVSHRMLTADQVRELAANDAIEVGAHTLSHPRLSTLPAAQQEIEICESKARLENVLDSEVVTFAYPFGEPADFDATTVRLVRAAGYSSAGAVRDLAVSRSSPLYELPRVGILDWDGHEFERRLEWWLRRGL
jgi:peptidoglycan/xylan/chitin deacetylase (PgdA/CDA1 family)